MILLFGNLLERHGYTPSFAEQLYKQLSCSYSIKTSSSEKNKIKRLLSMILFFLKNKKHAKLILVDTFSTNAYYFALIICFLAKIYKIPYCPILHGGNLPYRLKKSKRTFGLILDHSKQNITPSLFLKHEFDKVGIETLYIPNYIPIENYMFRLRHKIYPKILWVRSFHSVYNPLMAVKVLIKISDRFPDCKLCMVGPDKDGSMDKVKEMSKQFGVSSNLIITDKLSKKEWIKLSEDYDIFINTTNFDNMPVSVIEAMALGFPIISTNAGGLEFLHEDGLDALLVEKNDIDGMVEKITLLLENSEVSKLLSENARKKAENFAWENVRKEWECLIR